MYLVVVGVILAILSDNEIESDTFLIPCLTRANVSLIEIDSVSVLNDVITLANESLNDVDSANVLCSPCVLANKSVIITSPPLVVSNIAGSNTALSNFVNSYSISTV